MDLEFKRRAVRALRERVLEELDSLRRSQDDAQKGAIHEELRQEDPKDTRAIEAQYISRGLAERVEGLQEAASDLANMSLRTFSVDEPIATSALVCLEDDGEEKVYFLVPVTGGEILEIDAIKVQTLTPGSPLGSALVGRYVDDDVEVELPDRSWTAEVLWVK